MSEAVSRLERNLLAHCLAESSLRAVVAELLPPGTLLDHPRYGRGTVVDDTTYAEYVVVEFWGHYRRPLPALDVLSQEMVRQDHAPTIAKAS